MTVDRVTEEIAHFIGMFMQQDQPGAPDPVYDTFKHLRAEQSLSPLVADTPGLRHKYGPEGYNPLVRDEGASDTANSGSALKQRLALPVPEAPAPPSLADLPRISASDVAIYLSSEVEMPPVGESSPPHSYATVTLQENILSDRDVLSADPATVEAWLADQTQRLADLVHTASLLAPLDLEQTFLSTYPGFASVAELMDEARAVVREFESETASDPADTALRHIATGKDALGTFLDSGGSVGPNSDPLPVWRDALPQLPEITPIGTLGPSSFRIGDGTVSAITGGNFALNEAILIHQRVDAPVILVGGSVIAWDYISQVAVLQDDKRDADTGIGSAPDVQNAARLTKGFTSAASDDLPLLARTGLTPDVVFMSTIEGDLVNFSWTSQWNEADDSDVLTVNGGKSWIVTGQNTLINAEQLFTTGQGFDLIMVGGDMISVFAVSQVNILLDVDETRETPHCDSAIVPRDSAAPNSETPLPQDSCGGAPGDGQKAAPAASAIPESPDAEAASHTPVADSASDLSAGPNDAGSEAVNVALSPGKATAGTALDGTYDASETSSDQAASGHSTTVTHEKNEARTEEDNTGEDQRIASSSANSGGIQHTSGQTTSVHIESSQSGTGVTSSGTHPPPHPTETAEERPADPEPGPIDDAPLGPGTHENAVINSASINHTSVDKVSGLGDVLREMLEELDPLAPDLTALISSPVFAGLETMNVLYVAGDLVNVHVLTQSNIVADGDKLTGPGAKHAIAGANALVNSATLVDVGMDSHVMAGGDIYTDAFLHQAEFVADAGNTGPGKGPMGAQGKGPMGAPPLASEAVAFLADGMKWGGRASKHFEGDNEGIANSNFGDVGPHADIMQTFLA